VVETTRLVVGASGASPNGDICFPSEFSITASTFALGQVLNFRSQAYVTDCNGELHQLKEAMLASNETPTLPPLPGLLGVDLEVHEQHIWRG
jgi:hypothetical protein